MAKKRTSRRRKGFTIPIAMALPALHIGSQYYEDVQDMGFAEATRWQLAKWTGYYAQPNQPDWKLKHMKHALLPMSIGFGIHKIASRLGANRALAAAGVPFFRI